MLLIKNNPSFYRLIKPDEFRRKNSNYFLFQSEEMTILYSDLVLN